MKIILTGANGNLGQHILKNSDSEILSVSRGDWTSLGKIKKEEYDVLIHCAYDLKNNINSEPEAVLDSNIMTTAKVLKLCKEKGIPKLVFISSCSVYGDLSNADEDVSCEPFTMNGFTKLFNEELIKTFCSNNNISYLIIRAFNSYGGDDKFSVVQKMIECAKNKKQFTLVNDGDSERDFIHINDLANIVLLLNELDLENQIVNVGSGVAIKVINILNAAEKAYGKMEFVKSYDQNEIVHSRANLKKLKQLIDHKCINLLEFIADQ